MRLLLCCLLFLLLPASADAVWFNSNWDNRVKVEVVPSRVGTTSAITSFPVYFDLGGMPSGFWSNVQPDGDDIRVVESDEVTETAFHLVSISTTTQRGELHFLADSLATTSTSTFYIYYNNPAASAYAVTDTFGRNNVWSAYTTVFTMDATGTTTVTNAKGGTNGIKDATTEPNEVAGQIGRAQEYDGVNDAITIASPELDLYISFGDGAGVSGKICGFVSAPFQCSTGNITTGVWQKIRIEWTGSNQLIYINGVLDSTQAKTATARSFSMWIRPDATASTDSLYGSDGVGFGDFLGERSNGPNWPYDGILDHYTYRTGTVSAAWERTEYNNQSSTSTFFVVGPQEADAVPEATTTPQTVIQGGVFGGGMIIR